MFYLYASQLSSFFSGGNSTLLEIAKILLVSCGWIGGLILFVKRQEKKQTAINN